ncbi:MAG: Fic family protein [Candidatus Kaiserbacteria bacterium]|nr:Fic family protein [Candidatus Kaiserbacteria bacterium]
MAKKRFVRPRTKKELENLEVRGLWKAIAQSRELAESGTRITIEVILELHRAIFENAIPEIAGRFRANGEDVKKLKCHEPPPGRVVKEKIFIFWREFDRRISLIRQASHVKDGEEGEWIEEVFDLATWAQHQMTSIHPFCDGNGRMARLMTNTVLIRFEFPPSPLKFEGENKSHYLSALCQIDLHEDYEALKHIIIKGALQTLEKEERARINARRG